MEMAITSYPFTTIAQTLLYIWKITSLQFFWLGYTLDFYGSLFIDLVFYFLMQIKNLQPSPNVSACETLNTQMQWC